MKQSIPTFAIIAFIIFLGCNKKDTTPNTNNISNTTVVNAKWLKPAYTIYYNTDGVTESMRSEYTYDSEGRPTSSIQYQNGVIVMKNRDYTYTGNDQTYYTDTYSGGIVTSTHKVKAGYKND